MKYVCPLCLQETLDKNEILATEFRSHLIHYHDRQLESDFAFNVFMSTWKPEMIVETEDRLDTSMLED